LVLGIAAAGCFAFCWANTATDISKSSAAKLDDVLIKFFLAVRLGSGSNKELKQAALTLQSSSLSVAHHPFHPEPAAWRDAGLGASSLDASSSERVPAPFYL
jgi:hypothetical protein